MPPPPSFPTVIVKSFSTWSHFLFPYIRKVMATKNYARNHLFSTSSLLCNCKQGRKDGRCRHTKFHSAFTPCKFLPIFWRSAPWMKGNEQEKTKCFKSLHLCGFLFVWTYCFGKNSKPQKACVCCTHMTSSLLCRYIRACKRILFWQRIAKFHKTWALAFDYCFFHIHMQFYQRFGFRHVCIYSKIGCRRTCVLRGQARRSYLQGAFLSRSLSRTVQNAVDQTFTKHWCS